MVIKVYSVGHTDRLKTEIYIGNNLSYVIRTQGIGLKELRERLGFRGIIEVEHDVMFYIPLRARYNYRRLNDKDSIY